MDQQNELEIAQSIKELYKKGLEAFKKENFDYAVELFEQILSYTPDHIQARHYLRISERAKFKKRPPSPITFLFQNFSSFPILAKARISAYKGQNHQAIKEYEKALRINPNNENALKNLAQCLINLDLTEGAIEVLEEIRDINPDNITALRKLGSLYLKKESYAEAQDCFEKVLKFKPHDLDAERGLKNLAALGTIKKGGWEKQTSYREKILDQDATERLEKEDRTIQTENDITFLIEQLKKKISSGQESLGDLRKLADLQTQADLPEDALLTYQEIKEKNPDDIHTEEKITTLKLKIIDKKIKQKSGSDKEELHRLLKEKEELRIQDLKQRVGRFPNDFNLRYEYGKLLFETGKTDQAISQLQLAVNEPTKKTEALNLIGLAFKSKKMPDLALAQFKKAYESIVRGGKHITTDKEIIYNLAQTYEEMGNKESAIEQYKKIYETDITYKDVAKKIEEDYKRRSK